MAEWLCLTRTTCGLKSANRRVPTVLLVRRRWFLRDIGRLPFDNSKIAIVGIGHGGGLSIWDSSAGLINIVTIPLKQESGIVGPTHWQRTRRLIEAVRPNRMRHRVRLQIHAARLHVQTQRTSRRGKPWRLLRMSGTRIENGPGVGAPRPFVSKLQQAGDWVRQPKFLHSGTSQAAFLPRSLLSFGRRSGSGCAVLRTA